MSELFIGLLVIVLLVGLPHLLIWALNTLFGLQIEHSAINWLAALVIMGLLGSK